MLEYLVKMDDIGAEYISEISTATVLTPTTPQTPKDDPLKDQHSDITPLFEDLSLDSSDEGKEKADATPENIKKIDADVITLSSKSNPNEVIAVTGVHSGSTCEKIDDDDSSSIAQQLKNNMAMAFTIDFGGGNDNSLSEQQAAKYKNMVERFQNRHKRGVSMSKLESSGEMGLSVLPPTPPTTATKVKLRMRERSTSVVRDSSNRHSWSPRSSTHEASSPSGIPTPQPPAKVNKNSLNMQKSLSQKSARSIVPIRKREAFTPKSLTMQKAMEKFELFLPEPPLLSNGKNLAEADGISEAGKFVAFSCSFKH